MENRRSFLKQASCLTGVCLCGFSSIAQASTENKSEPDPKVTLMHDWISTLLRSIEDNTDKDACKEIMKTCANSHFEHLNMENFLTPFIGNIEKFNQFIEKEWDWKITYKPEEGIILADENKKNCVCPMVNTDKGIKSSIICYCSEGFAELMFSKVIKHPVKASVVSSIHKGDASCVYKINL